MKRALLLCLQVFVALPMATGRSDENRCRFRLRGSGRFSYPNVESDGISSKERNGTETKRCVIFGRVPWTRDVALQLKNNAKEVLLLVKENERKKWPNLLTVNRFSGVWTAGNFSGNATESFRISFPSWKANFTLTYTSVRARKFECPETWSGPRGIVLIKCEKRRLGSNCTFSSKIFSWDRPTKIFAKCGKSAFGSPAWIIKEESERMADGNPAELIEGDASDGGTLLENDKDMPMLCDTSHCNKFPENVQVVSCTNGSKIGSNCTLQCKDGYVPAPHLYEGNGNLFPRLNESVPLFWSKCRYEPRHDISPMWRPQVSTNGFKNFRNPMETYLDCMELNVAFELFVGEKKHYIDFSTAREFKMCPYKDDQVLHFYGEDDELGEASVELGMAEQLSQPKPTQLAVMLVPEDILTSLNYEEWRRAYQSLARIWCDSVMDSLKMALFQRPPLKEPNVFRKEEVQSVVDQLFELVITDCPRKLPDSPSGNGPRPIPCAKYCIWDKNGGGYVSCKNFPGSSNKKNCLKCKVTGGCQRSSYLG